jgi:hypothetical protein
MADIDYEKVLADLKERRAALDAAIAAIEQIQFGRTSEPGKMADTWPAIVARPTPIERWLRFHLSPSGLCRTMTPDESLRSSEKISASCSSANFLPISSR